MPAFRDLTGQRFGRLVVTGRAVGPRADKVYWAASCDCGGILGYAVAAKLVSGAVASCGCLRVEQLARVRGPGGRLPEVQPEDLTGRVFGQWTVLAMVERPEPGGFCGCECSCGNRQVIRASVLRTGDSTRCAPCRHAGHSEKLRTSWERRHLEAMYPELREAGS